MDVFEAVRARRSVKKFDRDHRMTESEIRKLMEAVICSPTAFNIQNWRFVVVTDEAQKARIRKSGWDQAQFTDCSLIVILTGDLDAYRRQPERYWKNVPKQLGDLLVGMIGDYYTRLPQMRRDEIMRSCGMAAQTLMLCAKAMGYDSCPMTGFEFDEVAQIINLPEDHRIAMAITVGKRLADPYPRGGQLPLDDLIVRNRFSD